MSVVLQLQDVRKVYGQNLGQNLGQKLGRRAPRAALDGVSLTVETAELVALLGPSGSGKTTLLNLAGGLDRATAGVVTVTGQDLGRLGETALARFRRQRVGIVFQAALLLPGLTALENVLLPARLAGVDHRTARQRAGCLLERLGVLDAAGALPDELDGGQQQRVAIARALVNRPSLLLADEPTGALDSGTAAGVMDLIAELGREGQTVVVATHDAAVAARHAQRVVRLLDGRIAAEVELAPQLTPFSAHPASGNGSGNGHHAVVGAAANGTGRR